METVANPQSIIDAISQLRGDFAGLAIRLEPDEREVTAFEVDLGTVTLTPQQPQKQLIQGGIKLPRNSEIRSCYVENNGQTAQVLVYAGGGGGGRLLANIGVGVSRTYAIPDGIRSLSVVAFGTANDVGSVRIAIATDVWAPGTNAIWQSDPNGNQFVSIRSGNNTAAVLPGGGLLTSVGGTQNIAIAVNTAANTVVKAAAGRLARILVTIVAASAVLVYDNAANAAGTIIGIIAANAPVGVYDFQMPAANGIVVAGAATLPALTVSYS